MLYLEELKSSYYDRQSEKFDIENSIAYQETIKLQNKLSRCWDRHDISMLLGKEVNSILWGNNKINIQIFDLRTNWFLWEKIFLHVDLIQNPSANATAKRQLNILREISSIFDLGK